MQNEEKIIKNVYAAFVVSLFMTFLPNLAAAMIAFVLFIGVLIAAYVLRAKSDKHSLMQNHMIYIIRTIWITGLFSLFTITTGSIYLLANYDPSLLQSCADNIVNRGSTDIVAMEAMLKPCMDDFMRVNMGVFLTATIISAGPLIIYMLFRMAKGIARAAKGHRIGDNKSWF